MAFSDILGEAIVKIKADLSDLQSKLSTAESKVSSSLANIQSKMKSWGTAMSVAITAPFALFASSAVQAAADAEEMQSKLDVTFGSSARAIRDWSNEYAGAVNRSATEIATFTTNTGALLKTAGFTSEAAADMSKSMVKLALDMASLNNVSDTAAIEAFRKALLGENEALKGVGLSLSQAEVKAQALKLGFNGNAAAMPPLIKAQATYNALLAKTSDAQGDLVRTSQSTANKLKGLSSAFLDLKIAVGQELIPSVRPLVDVVNAAVRAFIALPEPVKVAAVSFGVLAAAMGPILLILGTITAPIAAFAAGMASMVAGLYAAKQAWDSLGLSQKISDLIDWMRKGIEALGDYITKFKEWITEATGFGSALKTMTQEQIDAVDRGVEAYGRSGKGMTTWMQKMDEANAAQGRLKETTEQTTQAVNEQAAAVESIDYSNISTLSDRRTDLVSQLQQGKITLQEMTQEWRNIEAVQNQTMTSLVTDLESGKIAASDFERIYSERFTKANESTKKLKTGIGDIKGAFTGLLNAFKSGDPGQIFNAIFSLIEQLAAKSRNSANELNNAGNAAEDFGKKLENATSNGIQGMDGLFNSIQNVGSGASGLGGIFGNLFGGLGGSSGGGGFGSILGSIFGGGGGGGLFGGFFADGGQPPLGKVSVVGEQGPELFVPHTSGTIIPNDGVTGTQPIQLSQTFIGVDEQIVRKIREETPGIIQAATSNTINAMNRKQVNLRK